jgi:Ras-related protein Rab-4B
MTDSKSTLQSYKIVFAGFTGGGKSQIINRIATGQFQKDISPTVGGSFQPLTFTVDGKEVRLHIWDTSGNTIYRSIFPLYCRGLFGAVLVFDLTDRESFNQVSEWLDIIRSCSKPESPIILVGNKSDDEEHRTVTATEAEEFSVRHKLTYLETSAKTGSRIQEIFLSFGREILRKSEIDLNESTKEMNQVGDEVCLSAKGMQNILNGFSDERFTFFVGSIEYNCPLMIAKFLSPRICKIQGSDCTNLTFRIETPDPSGYFSEVISLGEGHMIEISKEKGDFLQSVGRELWNSELLHLSFSRVREEYPNDNILNWLRDLSESNCVDSVDLTFAASHFHEFSIFDIESLDFSILQSILSSPDLLLTDESSLYEMIRTLFYRSKDASYFTLLEFVQFEFLPTESIRSAIEMISESFNFLTIGIWESICQRLLLSVSPSLSKKRFRENESEMRKENQPGTSIT